MIRIALLLLVLAPFTPLAAQATVLYKSVDANGTVMFSDIPPATGARVVETRVVTPSGTTAAAPTAPPAAAANPLLALVESDAALAKANAQLDQAERELALARRDLLSPRAGLHLVERRMTAADDARVEFFKRNVAAARHALMELLRDRRNQMVAAAGRNDGSPRYYVSAR
jgi:hypothetical protein